MHLALFGFLNVALKKAGKSSIFSHLESKSVWRKSKTTKVAVRRDMAPKSAQLALYTPEWPVAEPGHLSCSNPFFTICTGEIKTNRNQNTHILCINAYRTFFNELLWKAVPSSLRRLGQIQLVARSHLTLHFIKTFSNDHSSVHSRRQSSSSPGLSSREPTDKAPWVTRVSHTESHISNLGGSRNCLFLKHKFQLLKILSCPGFN